MVNNGKPQLRASLKDERWALEELVATATVKILGSIQSSKNETPSFPLEE